MAKVFRNGILARNMIGCGFPEVRVELVQEMEMNRISLAGKAASGGQSLLGRLVVLLLAALAMAWSPAAYAKNIALIIANSDYIHGGDLRNPPNDAQLVAASARKAGFEVTIASNLDQRSFVGELAAFQNQARTADVAMIYYAGHGVETPDGKFLIPTDATLESELYLTTEAINLNLLVRVLSEADNAILVLDACRNNVFISNLTNATRSIEVGFKNDLQINDMLVLFSAGPGQTAEDGRGADASPFAQAFARYLPEEGQDLQTLPGKVAGEVLSLTNNRQRPFSNSGLSGGVFLVEAKPSIANIDDIATAWNLVSQIHTVEAYQQFVDKFPNGGGLKEQAMGRMYMLQQEAASGGSQPQQQQFVQAPVTQTPVAQRPVVSTPASTPSSSSSSASNPAGLLGNPNQGGGNAVQPQGPVSVGRPVEESVAQAGAGSVQGGTQQTSAQLAQASGNNRPSGGVAGTFQNATEVTPTPAATPVSNPPVQQDAGLVLNTNEIQPALEVDPLNSTDPCINPNSNFAAVRDCGPLPQIPAAPQFSVANYPACRDDYLSGANNIARVDIVDRCTKRLTDYYSNDMNSFVGKMNDYLSDVSRIYEDDVAGRKNYYTPSTQQGFFRRVERITKEEGIKETGSLYSDHRATEARYNEDMAFLRNKRAELVANYNN
jgi:hypothetical protein